MIAGPLLLLAADAPVALSACHPALTRADVRVRAPAAAGDALLARGIRRSN